MDKFNSPYCVEASDDPDTEEPAVCEHFETKKAALDFAERQMHRFRCVWVSVLAAYETRTGRSRTGHVYFWWTPATEFGELPSPGWGYPESALSTLTEYSESLPSKAYRELTKLIADVESLRRDGSRSRPTPTIGMSIKNARTGRRTKY